MPELLFEKIYFWFKQIFLIQFCLKWAKFPLPIIGF